MKNETGCIVLYSLLGIPAVISVLSWFGPLVSLANIGMMANDTVVALAKVTMLLFGTYVFTYAYSLYKTIQNKKLTFSSFLPVIHMALVAVFMFLWSYAEMVA